ncbi:MAG: DNA modification methylase [Clostridia bacterium]
MKKTQSAGRVNTEMEIRLVPVEELKPAKYNPRKDLKAGDPAYEKIKRSMKDFGYVDPIIWNEVTGNIVGGHQRFKVLAAEGAKELACVVVHIENPDDEKALNVVLNKAVGEWEPVALADLLQELQSKDYDVASTGFDAAEVDEILSNLHDKDVKDDEFDVDAELAKPCFSRPGDVWHLGRHTVICGDSTQPETYERLLGDVKANLVCTDPPYMVSLNSASGKITNDDLSDGDALVFLQRAFSCLHDAMAKDASIYVFYATAKARIFHDAFEDSGFKVGAGLVWKKDRLVLTRTDWKYNHEPLIWGWRKDGKHIWYGDQAQTTVFEFPRVKNSKEDGFGHPSSKPVPLIAYLVKQCTMSNGIVLDAFLGSASTLIACEQLGRVCYGIELEPKFVDVAVSRFVGATEGKPDVYVLRDGRKLTLEEAKACMELTEELDG